MFPLFLDLTDRLAVVVGGGPVGRRKASAVRASGGRVRLICLEPRPPEETNDPLFDWRTQAYVPEHLDGAALVFAAGPPELNTRVVADARARGVWVNTASEPEQGDFILPALVRRGDFVLAVGTGGAAPLLAQVVRDRLVAEFDEAFGVWVQLLAELRPVVKERIADDARRRVLLTRLCQWEWLERLRREGEDAVRAALHAEVEATAHLLGGASRST
jgi:precorrin-2 dehydrogenase/sirohydrochlorin ferrochelatase